MPRTARKLRVTPEFSPSPGSPLRGMAIADDPADLPDPQDLDQAPQTPNPPSTPTEPGRSLPLEAARPPKRDEDEDDENGPIDPRDKPERDPSSIPEEDPDDGDESEEEIVEEDEEGSEEDDGELDRDRPAEGPGTAAQGQQDLTTIQYVSRIQVLEAYQYPGQLQHPKAPDWIDRNWVGWADYDPLRQLEPGPCLRVPTSSGDMVTVRPGDYVVQQLVRLTTALVGDIKLEVWEKEQFHRLFLPINEVDALQRLADDLSEENELTSSPLLTPGFAPASPA